MSKPTRRRFALANKKQSVARLLETRATKRSVAAALGFFRERGDEDMSGHGLRPQPPTRSASGKGGFAVRGDKLGAETLAVIFLSKKHFGAHGSMSNLGIAAFASRNALLRGSYRRKGSV